MSDKENVFEKQLNCPHINIIRLEEDDLVMENFQEKMHKRNDLLKKQIGKKEVDISHLRSKMDCKNQRRRKNVS